MVANKKTSIFLLAICLLGLSGCGVRPEGVRLGFVGPFDGPYRELGTQLLSGARYALDEWNVDSNQNSFVVDLIAYNDYGLNEKAMDIATSIEADESIDFVLGHWVGVTTQTATGEYLPAEFDQIYFLPVDQPRGHNLSTTLDIIDKYIDDTFDSARYIDFCDDNLGDFPDMETPRTPVLCEPEQFFDSHWQDQTLVFVLGSGWSPSEEGAVTILNEMGEKGPFFMQGYLGARYAIMRIAQINANHVGVDAPNMYLEQKNMFMSYYWSGQTWELQDISFGG